MSDYLKGLDYKYRDLIFEVTEKFNSIFLKKELIYTYRDKSNSRKELIIACKPSNLMHLCGIAGYCEPTSNFEKNAIGFFSDALDNKLNMENIWYKDELLISTKLHALTAMEELLKKGVSVCGAGKFDLLTFDNAIRTGKTILAITYIVGTDSDKVPNSAIDLRTNKSDAKVFESSCRVSSITTRNTDTNEISIIEFNHITKSKKNKKKKKKQKLL